MSRQPGIAIKVLTALEPTLFPEERRYTKDDPRPSHWYDGYEVDILCMAARTRRDSLLPHVTHVMDDTLEALTAAISQHYVKIGQPLRGLNSDQILEGYFDIIDGKEVTCRLDTKTEKSKIDFKYATDIVLQNPMRMDTVVEATVQGRAIVVQNLEGDFEADGVHFPPEKVAWQGDLFATEVEAAAAPEKKTPVKRKSKAAAEEAARKVGSTQVSEALRRRLASPAQAKASPGSKK